MNTDKLNAYCTSYNRSMYTFLSAYIYPFNYGWRVFHFGWTGALHPVRSDVFPTLASDDNTLKIVRRDVAHASVFAAVDEYIPSSTIRKLLCSIDVDSK